MSSRFEDIRFAPIWRRAIGATIDSIIVGLAMASISFFASRSVEMLSGPDETGDRHAVAVIVTIAAWLLQLAIAFVLIPWAIGHDGQTIGMKAVGVEIVSARTCELISTGGAILRGIAQAFLPFMVFCVFIALNLAEIVRIDVSDWRQVQDLSVDQGQYSTSISLTKLVSLLSLANLLNFAFALVTRKSQTMYDLLSGTVSVVRRPRNDW